MTTVIDVIIKTSQELLDKIKNVQQSAREQHKEKKEAKKEEEKAAIEAAIVLSKEGSDSAINDPKPPDEIYAKRKKAGRYIDIAVVDESSSYNPDQNDQGLQLMNSHQTEYRSRNKENTFVLLQPLDPQDPYAGPLDLPIEFYGPVPPLTGPDAPPPPPAYYEVVTRPGDNLGRTNWIILIEGLTGVPFNSEDRVRLSIDNSGSMTINTVYADYKEFIDYLDEVGALHHLVYMTDERWIFDLRDSAQEFWDQVEAGLS